jgi:hypothetical protein
MLGSRCKKNKIFKKTERFSDQNLKPPLINLAIYIIIITSRVGRCGGKVDKGVENFHGFPQHLITPWKTQGKEPCNVYRRV